MRNVAITLALPRALRYTLVVVVAAGRMYLAAAIRTAAPSWPEGRSVALSPPRVAALVV